MKEKILKTSTYILLAVVLLVTIVGIKIASSVSFGVGTAEILLEANLEKCINYALSEEEKGTLVEYRVKANLQQEEAASIENSEIKMKLNQIDGKYPENVVVVRKGMNLEGKYEYHSETGEVVVKDAIEQNNSEYVMIGYYNTYLEENEERDIVANVTATATLAGEEKLTVTANQEVENKVLENVGQLTSINHVVEELYNGYIKSNQINGTDYNTQYRETEEIMISKKQAQEKIEMEENNTFENGQIGAVYKNTKIKKETLVEVLGEEGKVEILDAEGNVMATLDKDNQEANYETELESISIRTSEIQKEGILELEHSKEIKATMASTENKQLKTTTKIAGAEDLENIVEIKDAQTNVGISVNNAEWTNKQQNEITFDVSLKANGKADNLFKNPTVRIELPNEVEKVILQNSGIFYPNGLELQEPYVEENENGNKVVVANLVGTQTQYTENELDLTTDVKITATIILKKDMQETESNVKLTYINQYGSTQTGEKELGLKLESYQEEAEPVQEEIVQNYQLATATAEALPNVEGLKLEVAPVKGGTEIVNGDSIYEGEYIKYDIKVTNTSDETMNNVKVVGSIPEGITYGELVADYYQYNGDYYYNFDENVKSKEIEIGTLEPGETITKFYEVKVNDLAEGQEEKEIATNIKAYVGQAEAATYELTNMVKTANANLFVSAKLDNGQERWNYFVQLTGEQEKEVTVMLRFPKEFQFKWLGYKEVLETMPIENISVSEDNVVTAKLKIDNDNPYKFEGILDSSKIDKNTQPSSTMLVTTATMKVDDQVYTANENRIFYEYSNASIHMTSPNEGEEVKYGEEIEYDIMIENTGGANSTSEEAKAVSVQVTDFLPENVEPVSVTYETWEQEKVAIEGENEAYISKGEFKKQEITQDITNSKEDEEGNQLPNVEIEATIPYQESITIKVKTTADMVYERTRVENSATLTSNMDYVEEETTTTSSIIGVKTSNIMTHTILPYDEEDPEDPDDPDDPTNPNNPKDPTNPDDPTQKDEKYSISGVAWLDKNEDGQRQTSEKLLSGITAMVVDMKDAKNVKAKVTTDNNGAYRFSDLEKGNYLVLFQYDTNQYRTTEYQKTGVNSQFNSDAVVQEITLNGETIKAGMIEVNNLEVSVSNMDIGLVENKICDFKLDKSITKVTVTTNSGAKQYNYNNEKLAKIEIRAKEIQGATVIVEYKIVITNEGELPSTVGKVIDYLPEGLTFSSELNKNWSAGSGGQLINTSISNKKIQPGESAELTLVATKAMTANSTGTFINAAEIGDITNSLGIADKDSTPANKAKSEDDYSEATVILSVSTGIYIYLSIGIVLAVLVAIAIGVGMKKGKIKFGKITKISMFLIMMISLILLQNTESLAITGKYAPSTTYFTFGGGENGTIFYGGPAGIGYCMNHGAANQDKYPPYPRQYHLTKETVTVKSSKVTSTGPSSIKLKGNIDANIAMKKFDNNNYLFGPFTIECDNDKGYTFVIKDANGDQITDYSICNNKGESKTIKGDGTFYLKVPNSKLANGISSIKVTNKAQKMVTVQKKIHVYAEYSPSIITNAQGVYCSWDKDITEQTPTTLTASIKWTHINGALKIVKEDKDTGEKMPNVEMKVTASGGYSETFTTDANGEIYIDNLVAGKKYKVTEVKVPYYGYTATVTVNKTLKKGRLNVFTLKNEKQTGNLQIIKKDLNNNDVKLQGVTFKVKDVTRGYLVIQDADKVAQKQVSGTTYLSDFPQYTADEAEATEFATDANGLVEIRNLWIGKYEVTETSVGDNPAYEVDPEYISWNANGTNLGKGLTATVEVTKQSSKDTKPDSSNPKKTALTAFNKRKYISLSGYVWEDLACSKDPRFIPFYNSEGAYGDLNDKKLQGIKVELVKINAETGEVEEVKEQLTDENGNYRFEKIKIDDIPNCYVRFYYNGMCYENIAINIGAHNGSKAGEGTTRQDFNQSYSKIEGNTADTGVALDQDGNKTHDLTYNTTDTTSEISYRQDRDESQYNFGYEENKDSKCPVNGVDDQYMITATTQNAYEGGNLDKIYTPEEIGKQSIDEIENINLGVQKRAKPDITLGKDLHNVKMTINGYGHTYFYGKRFDPNPEYTGKGFNVGVKFKDKWTGTYTREIYRSDFDYNPKDISKELKVYITYELKMVQANADVKARVNSIVDYYDKNYELVKIGSSIDPDSGEITEDIKIPDEIETIGKYKKVVIENNTELEPNKETSIYVQFAMNKEAIAKVLDVENENLDNVAEINSYSIFDAKTGVVSAGIDLDSNPGNAVPEEKADYEGTKHEDDTSTSPGLQLKTKDARKLTGKVFIDQAEGGLQLQTNQIRQGNGQYDNDLTKEPGVGGVIITFGDPKNGMTYETETVSEAGKYGFVQRENKFEPEKYNEAKKANYKYSGDLEAGDFLISDYIPGDYTLTYTWGGQTYTLNGQQETITVQDYKGTIYKESERKDNKEWYKLDLNTDSRRYSDAMDDWQTRLDIDKEIETVRNNTVTTISKMNSTTPEMKVRIECQGNEDRQIEGIEYQEGNDENYKDKYEYFIRNVDFGIIERAKQDMAISKRVKSLKLTLANGQVIADLKVEEDQNGKRTVTGERSGVTYMPPEVDQKSNGFVRLELDNELIQGSRLEVTYEFKVTNQSELDYKSEKFYHFGIIEGTPITMKPTEIIDYLDKDWAFDEEGSDWKVKTLEDVKDYLDGNVANKDEGSTIENKKILLTEKLATKDFEPGHSETLELNVSKILTTTDEILFDNETEIVELSREYGSMPESTPGNYIPGKDKFVESDDSMAETVSVTSATGDNREFILPIMIGVTACIILGAGVIFIKKKVL